MPWKNHWYFIAIGAVTSAISLVYHSWYIIFLYVIWLLYLLSLQQVKRSIVLVCICCLLFFYFYLPSPVPPTESTAETVSTKITGTIVQPVIHTDLRMEFVLEEENGDKLLVYYFKENDTLHAVDSFRFGAVCALTGIVSYPDQATNPHQFDYRDYLWKQGITQQLLLTSLEQVSCSGHTTLDSIYTLRYQLMHFTATQLEEYTTAWLHALVFGDDSLLDEAMVDVFQRWGLSHLLAISGLHIGIVVALIYILLIRFSLMTKEKAQTTIMVLLPIYAILAGGQPSVWRASLMVILVILMTKMKQKMNYSDIISIIFLFLMVLNKQIIYHVGFQLSFAVTFALIISKKWLAQSTTNIESIFKISFVSQMAILPLQLHYFSLFQPLSILLNIVIVPYFSIFVIPGMFLFLLGSFLPKAILIIPERIFFYIHDFAMSILEILDHYLDYPFIIGELSLLWMSIYYVLFVIMMIVLEKGRKQTGFQIACILSLYIGLLALRPYFSPYGTVTMLDIGQGDAFVIEMPYRQGVFLIDAGASFSFTEMEPSDKVYKQVIQPYLYGQGIHVIDAIFISHEDLDHDGSVPMLINDFIVKEVVVSPYYIFNDYMKGIDRDLVYTASFDESIKRQGQLFHIVSPNKDVDSANENSLVVYTEVGGLSWFFSGDVGKETERQIIQDYPNIKLDVLKVGHHGSNTSTDPSIAKRSNQGVAFISVGENNMYGHPTKEVMETLNQEQLHIFRTDQHGAVQYRFKEDSGVFIPFFPK